MVHRIGILGGTFNPPHNGHLALAACARDALELKRVVFIPSAVPPHKPDSGAATGSQRMEMTRLATQHLSWADVSDIEQTRGGKNYTVDTAAQLRLRHPGCELWLIVGADMFVTLDSWRRADELLRNINVAAMARGGSRRAQLEQYAVGLTSRYGCRAVVIDAPVLPVSSTEIRSLAASGGSWRGMVPGAVGEYIVRERLYTDGHT